MSEAEKIDMDAVEENLKAMKPEDFNEISARLSKVAEERKAPVGPNLGVMTDGQFREHLRKLGL